MASKKVAVYSNKHIFIRWVTDWVTNFDPVGVIKILYQTRRISFVEGSDSGQSAQPVVTGG
jgi:hypothetical protein